MSQNYPQYTGYPPCQNGPAPAQQPPYPQPPMPQQIPMRPVVLPRPETKNKFLTFVCALVPGAGQMYHGLFRRGITIALLFFGVIALSSLTYIGEILVTLPVIWFYSFFDTVNRMNMPVQEMKLLEDRWPFSGLNSGGSKNRVLAGFLQKKHIWIGSGLILAAIWLFLNILFETYYWSELWWQVLPEEIYKAIRTFVRMFPSFLVPVFCILLGIRLISGKKQSAAGKARYDDTSAVSQDTDGAAHQN